MITLVVQIFIALHTYFFAFAEMEFNKETNVYEVSISSIAHDFENHMKKKGVNLGHIEKINKTDTLFSYIEREVNNGFIVTPVNGEVLFFKLEGFEVDLKDNLTFFLTSNKTVPFKEANISFQLMMETFPDQQNKMNYIHNGQKKSLTFIKAKSNRKLSL